MSIVNPVYNFWSADNLSDLADRRAQVDYTTAAIQQGEIDSASWTTSTFPLGTNGQLPSAHRVTSAVANNRGTTSGDSLGPIGTKRECCWQVKLAQTTACRLFVVVSNSQFTDGDAPTGDFMGFRYSTNVPDTNWQCVSNNNGTMGATDSGVAASTNEILFGISYSSSAIQYFINRNLVATRTTALPRITQTAYCWRVFLTTLAAATKEVDVSFYNERYYTA